MRRHFGIEFGRPALGALLAVGLAGCNQLAPLPDDAVMDELPRSVDQALTRSCATDATCHVPGNGIVVLAGASLAALDDGGYVRRGNLEGSTLAVKMLRLPGITGGVMPPATHPADPTDLALIIAWIAGIDPDDGGASSGTEGASESAGDSTGAPVPMNCLQGETLSSPPRLSELWPMIEAQCSALDGCHAMQTPVMLDEASAYANLVDATNVAGLTFVSPGSPDESYLWHKVVGTHVTAGGSGARMPLGAPLCDAGLVGMYAWILGGAVE